MSSKVLSSFFSLIKRKFLINHDKFENISKAKKWAASNAISYKAAFKKLGLVGKINGMNIKIIIEAKKLEKKSSVKMGGPAHINLLYDCVQLLNATKVIETGVAYGWSSLAILKAFKNKKNAKLYSVDMPYPLKNNENDVGIVVPDYLKKIGYL